MEHYIVSTEKLDGASIKIAVLKNIYNCNSVYVNEVVVSNFSENTFEIIAVKNIENTGDGELTKKGISTDFSNNILSKSILYYNNNFVNEIDNNDIVFNEIGEIGNVRIKLENPIILKPCNSFAIMLKLDNETSFNASVKFSFDETSVCACCYCK